MSNRFEIHYPRDKHLDLQHFAAAPSEMDNRQKKLFDLINDKWERLKNEDFEDWLASLGILWAELEDYSDGPKGTVVVWEGPGFKNEDFKMCWVITEDVALKLLVLG